MRAPDGSVRQPWYGAGWQPWDDIVGAGWGPEFAAGNVLKYLRRSKEPEHSLASARWYYRQLVERSRQPNHWWATAVCLRRMLTAAEIAALEDQGDARQSEGGTDP